MSSNVKETHKHTQFVLQTVQMKQKIDETFCKMIQAVNAIYVTQRNFGILGVGVAIMDISQHLFFTDVFHAIYNMHKFYRKIWSHQPIISV